MKNKLSIHFEDSGKAGEKKSIFDLYGSDPDFTGGLTPEEFLRKQRDEDSGKGVIKWMCEHRATASCSTCSDERETKLKSRIAELEKTLKIVEGAVLIIPSSSLKQKEGE